MSLSRSAKGSQPSLTVMVPSGDKVKSLSLMVVDNIAMRWSVFLVQVCGSSSVMSSRIFDTQCLLERLRARLFSLDSIST